MRLAKQKLGAQQNGYGRIGCDIDIYNEIAEIADKCGYTLTSVTNALLGFALENSEIITCLLYTSDAADDTLIV